MPALEMMKKDGKYKQYVSLTNNSDIFNTVDPQSIHEVVEETIDFMTKRATYATMRLLGTQDFLDKIIELNMTVQNYRSRLVQQAVLANKLVSFIESALDALEEYLLATYRNELKRDGYTTAADAKAIVRTLTHGDRDYASELIMAKENVMLVIADLDKAHYALKQTLDAYTSLVRGGERTL